MIGIGLGVAVGLLLAAGLGLDSGAAWVLAAVLGLLGYLADCAVLPIDKCWRCGGEEWIMDKRGKRRQKPCWRCKRRRIIRRPGARLIGAKGRRE